MGKAATKPIRLRAILQLIPRGPGSVVRNWEQDPPEHERDYLGLAGEAVVPLGPGEY